jgi:hypothetical protein
MFYEEQELRGVELAVEVASEDSYMTFRYFRENGVDPDQEYAKP